MKWIKDDGGRAEAGYKGTTGDCCVRAIAIVTGKPYQEVYDALNEISKEERWKKRRGKKVKSDARTGVFKRTSRKYIESLGYKWTATMHIGSGCKVHMKADELPSGRLIIKASRHMTAVIDGVVHDTYDPSREGARCVYGYFKKEEEAVAE